MKRPKVTRREFLALTSFSAAGAYIALHPGLGRAMMGGGGTGGAVTVLDPPPGFS